MTEFANSLGQPNSAEGILGLAQRLHDEHVAEGQATKDRLISEAEVQAERILFEARAESERLHLEADEYHTRTLAEAEREVQEAVENSAERVAAIYENITSLQQFEAHYRSKIKKLINDTQALLDSTVEDHNEEPQEVTEDTFDNEEETTVSPVYELDVETVEHEPTANFEVDEDNEEEEGGFAFEEVEEENETPDEENEDQEDDDRRTPSRVFTL